MSSENINDVIGPNFETLEDGSLDAGLLLLELATPPGISWSLGDIAKVCGTRPQSIYYIEQKALRKIRAELARRGIDRSILANLGDQ